MSDQEKTMNRLIDCLMSIDNHLVGVNDRLAELAAVPFSVGTAWENVVNELQDDFTDLLKRHWAGERLRQEK